MNGGRGRRAAWIGLVALGCTTGSPGPAANPEPAARAWPPAGAAQAEPLPLDGRVAPVPGAEALAAADRHAIWAADLDGVPPDEVIAVWPATGQDGEAPGWMHAAYRLEPSPDGATQPELLWEALEPAQTLALVDREGKGRLDLVGAGLFERCPDPLVAASPCPEGARRGSRACRAADASDPCLMLRLWSAGNGVPLTYRTESPAAGEADSFGDPGLDRLSALLLGAPCPLLDLRALAVSSHTGLTTPARPGELLEGVWCEPAPGEAPAERRPFLALAGEAANAALFVPLAGDAGPEAARTIGYRLLDDLGSDGLREWLWIEPTATGTRYRVTAGPGRGATAGSFFEDATTGIVARLVVAPLGGRLSLVSLGWRGGERPAALVRARLDGPDGAAGPEEDLEFPLDVP